MKRLLAIGDIHGCSMALKTLVEFAGLGREDTVVTLGDYIDRGPDSRGVLDLLMSLEKKTRLVSLRGNHEIMLQEACLTREALFDWLLNGGDATLDSYQAKSFEDIPAEHWQFINSCADYHETEKHIFVHANLQDDLPMSSQPEMKLFWEHLSFSGPRHMSGKITVCGHTPQRSGVPLNMGSAVCIDTHACAGKWLTCLDVNSGRYWQANQSGKTREGNLEPAEN